MRTVNRDMTYDPSHRMPPRQERWPAATPAEGWPSYRDGEQEDFGYAGQAATAGNRYRAQGAVATAAYPAVTNGYGGYAGAADDFDGRDGYGRDGYGYQGSGVGYAEPQSGYAEPRDGYAEAQGGYADARDGYEWAAPDRYAGDAYLGPGSYVEPGAVLTDNRVLIMLSAVANRLIAQQVERLQQSAPARRSTQAGLTDAHRAHGHLVDLIARGDGAQAEDFWRKHLHAGREFLASGPRAARSVLDLLP